MSTPAAKIPPKRMGLGISPEIQKTMDAVKEVAVATNIPTQHYPSSRAPAQQTPADDAKPAASNVQTFQPAPPTQERKARGPKPAPVRRYSVDLPVYLIDEIGDKAHKQRIKKRVFILNCFQKAGLTVKDVDLNEGKSDE